MSRLPDKHTHPLGPDLQCQNQPYRGDSVAGWKGGLLKEPGVTSVSGSLLPASAASCSAVAFSCPNPPPPPCFPPRACL